MSRLEQEDVRAILSGFDKEFEHLQESKQQWLTYKIQEAFQELKNSWKTTRMAARGSKAVAVTPRMGDIYCMEPRFGIMRMAGNNGRLLTIKAKKLALKSYGVLREKKYRNGIAIPMALPNGPSGGLMERKKRNQPGVAAGARELPEDGITKAI